MITIFKRFASSNQHLFKSANLLRHNKNYIANSGAISSTRSYFTENEFNNLKFNAKRNELLANKTLLEQVGKTRIKLNESLVRNLNSVEMDALLEDLKNFIYLVDSDQDFDIIFKVFQKYSNLNLNKFYLTTLFVRRLLLLNKIDLVLKIFNDKNFDFNFMKEMTPMTCLLDKLLDEQKFEDVLRLYDDKLVKMRKLPNSFLTAVTFSLYKQNTSESFKKLKAVVNKRTFLSVDSLVHIFLLSLNQDEMVYALNLLSNSTRIHRSLFNNLIAIGLINVGDSESGFMYIENIAQNDRTNESSQSIDGKIFPITLKYLKEASYKSKDKKQIERYEGLNEFFLRNGRILKTDLADFYSKSSIRISSAQEK